MDDHTQKTSPPDPSGKPDWALSGAERRARAGRPRRRRWPWIVLLLLIVAGGFAWYHQRGKTGPAGQGATQAEKASDRVVMQLLPEEMTRIAPAVLRDTVKVTGALSPQQQAHLSAEVSGRLASVAVREGDSVAAGQVLAQIDTQTLENQLAQQRANAAATRAQLRLAQTELTRTRSMVDRGVAASSTLESDQASVDQLQASLNALEAQVVNAQDSIAKARIIAPFAGVISEREVDPGAYVGTGTALFTLVDLSQLEFEALVPVRYAPQVSAGQTVDLTVEGLGERRFTGTVDRIAPVAVSGTRMLPVYVDIANPDGVLRGGMFASGQIVLDRKENALAIPAEALLSDPQGAYVLKIVDGRTVRQPVGTGRAWEGGRVLEVSSGLKAGDTVVALPLEGLRAGAEIQVIAEPDTRSAE